MAIGRAVEAHCTCVAVMAEIVGVEKLGAAVVDVSRYVCTVVPHVVTVEDRVRCMTTNEWFAGGAARAMRGMEWPSCHGSRRVLTRVLSQSCTIVTSTDPTTKTKKTIVVIAPSCEFMRVASEESGISFEKMSSRSAVVLFFRLFSLACQDEWSCSAALHLRRFRRRCRLLTVTNRHGHGGIGERARRLQAIAIRRSKWRRRAPQSAP